MRIQSIARIVIRAAAGVVAGVVLVAAMGTAHAYPTPSSGGSVVSAPSSVAPGSTFSITFRFVLPTNQPLVGAPVSYSASGDPPAILSGRPTTDANGEATANVRAGNTGTDFFTATAGGMSVTATIRVTGGGPGAAGGVVPTGPGNTGGGTDGDSSNGLRDATAGLIAAAVVALACSSLIVLRRRRGSARTSA